MQSTVLNLRNQRELALRKTSTKTSQELGRLFGRTILQNPRNRRTELISDRRYILLCPLEIKASDSVPSLVPMLSAAKPGCVVGFGNLERASACAICTRCDPMITPTLSGVGFIPARNCILGVIMLHNSAVILTTHAGSSSKALSPRSGRVIATSSSNNLNQ